MILNGSGRKGEATKAEALLKKDGFNVIKTGNANSFDYEQTDIRFKETVSNEFILTLDKTLKSVYDFIIVEKLEENSESDILIIIGQN